MNLSKVKTTLTQGQFTEFFLQFAKESTHFDEFLSLINLKQKSVTLFDFSAALISDLRVQGKLRLAETYSTSVESFKRFLKGDDILLQDIDGQLLAKYESYLISKKLTLNTTSFYMRNLRSIYNRAVEKGLIIQMNPFKRVYTGVDVTNKRALPISVIKDILDLKLERDALIFARDLFIFSFYLRGISFVDIAYLTHDNLKGGYLVYRRRKTNQELSIKWEPCMQEIVNRYHLKGSKYLLPILNENSTDLRHQYLRMSHNVNRKLGQIGRVLNLPHPLTMYVARHSWASAAMNKRVPLAVISQAMGHDSEKTTKIYLSALDKSEIDEANNLLINALL